jgi:hypothetical protein
MKRIILVLMLMALLVLPIAAEGDTDNVNFTGVIEVIDGPNLVMVINGFTVDVSNIELSIIEGFTIGTTVSVSGTLNGSILVAEIIEEPEADDVFSDIVIVIIEGPVEEIDGSRIIIFGFNIELEADDLRLTVIEIGDILRVQGVEEESDDDASEDEYNITIVAIFFIFVDVDVFVFDGDIWRDANSCLNAPPPWAAAWGWHRRCDNNGGGSRRGGSGSGRGGSHRGGS